MFRFIIILSGYMLLNMGCINTPQDAYGPIIWRGCITLAGSTYANATAPIYGSAARIEGNFGAANYCNTMTLGLGAEHDTTIMCTGYNDWIDVFLVRNTNLWDELFTIKTGSAIISSEIVFPDSISFLMPIPDTTVLNISINLSWRKCAQFYLLNFVYTYLDTGLKTVFLQDLLIVDTMGVFTDTSITIPGSVLSYNGFLKVLVIPINGPEILVDTQHQTIKVAHNMTGNGSGIVYTSNYGNGCIYNIPIVIVGQGIQGFSKTKAENGQALVNKTIDKLLSVNEIKF